MLILVPSLLRNPLAHIVFGKYKEAHPCNPQSVRIKGGLDEDHMINLYDGPMKNDNAKEIKDVRNSRKVWTGKMERTSPWKNYEEPQGLQVRKGRRVDKELTLVTEPFLWIRCLFPS